MTVRHSPETGQAVPLAGPPGTERVLVCGAPHAPPSEAALQNAWDAPSKLPSLPIFPLLRADLAGTAFAQQGRDFGAPVDRPDTESLVHQRLAELVQSLRGRVEFWKAVACAKLGSESDSAQ